MAKKQNDNLKNKKPWAVLKKGVLTAALTLGVLTGGAVMSGCSGQPAANWHYGTEDPTEELGKIGDFYYETDDNDVWVYAEDGWKVISNLKGDQGDPGEPGSTGATGLGITSIEKTGTEGLVDTYTITYSNNTTTTFTVTNGAQGIQGIQGVPGESGHTPVITIQNGNWFIDGEDTGNKAQGVKGDTGIGISDISKESTEGLVDTYKITYTNGDYTTFTVTNGAQGIQGIQGVPGQNGHTPVITIENGNWFIDGVDTGKAAQGQKGDKGDEGRTGFFVSNESELRAALNADNTYLILMNDIYLYEQLDIKNDTVIDLNGHTISCSSEIWNLANKKWSALSVNGGSLTIKGEGTVQTLYDDSYAFDVRNGGNLVIEDGTFYGNISAVYVFDGTLTVNGGEFKLQQLSEYDDHRYLLNCYDANFAAGKAKIYVNGGKFMGFDPSAAAECVVGEGLQSVVYEEYTEYNVYKVVDPTDTTIEDYYLTTEALVMMVEDGELVEDYTGYTVTIDRANGQKENIDFADVEIDVSGFTAAGTSFVATLKYETIEAKINILPISNISELNNGNYEINANLNGPMNTFLCELNGNVSFDDLYLNYYIYSYENGVGYNYVSGVTQDMLVGFDNTVEAVNSYSFDEAKVGCYISQSVSVLVYNPATATIRYTAYATFVVGEGSYDKIYAGKIVDTPNGQASQKVTFDKAWLNGQEIDFNAVGKYTLYNMNYSISIEIVDPQVCNIENVSLTGDFDNLQILKGSTETQIEEFITNYILNSNSVQTTGYAHFYKEVDGKEGEQFVLTRNMIDLSKFDINKVGEQEIIIKYTQNAGYVEGKTVAYETFIAVTVYVDMTQANPVGDPYNAAPTSMIPNTMGYTSIQLFDNGCAYVSTRYSSEPNLVEYVKTQIGETNKYLFKYFETNAGGYIYFELTEDATNGNTFDTYIPTGEVKNTYSLDMEGMPFTVSVYGTEGTCIALCSVSMGGMTVNYATVDFTYNQDGTVNAMGQTYVIGEGNVLTPKA